jgi:sortase (surface protein transpeptidase)
VRWIVVGVGACIMLAGAAVLIAPWFDAARWQGSPEAERAVRNADAPTLVVITPTPLRVTPPTAAPAPTPVPPATAVAVFAPPELSTPVAMNAHIDVAPSPTPSKSDLTLGDTAFAFDDPPEPGAHAHLSLSVHNPTDAETGPISLALPRTWLAGYRLDALDPTPIDGTQSQSSLTLRFDGPPPHGDAQLLLTFVTTDEVIDAPKVTVLDSDGRKVGDAQPKTEAPQPKPGPIYSIDIPKLKLHSGVVPVDWEPPLFVVGQLRDSAWVTRGNSVLVGHVRGAAGYNVFDHLDQLDVGDSIVANSRGAAYDFVVTAKQQLPEDDTSPTDSTISPRLTLMTCAGDWNPITRDYSDRLWVVAEPADAVQATTAASASTPSGAPVTRSTSSGHE